MSIFDGLGKFGLGDLAESNLFEEEKKNEESGKAAGAVAKTPEELEAEMLLDKKYKCPQCDKEFTSKVVRSGKAKPIGQDVDLRTKYENIDCTKYDVIMCPNCGYAALPRFFNGCTPPQLKLIKDNISLKFQKKEYTGAIYTYDEALERYQMALINALVKKGYVNRERSEKDRRVVLISNTEKGQRAFDHHAKFHDDMIKALLGGLSEEESRIMVQAFTNLKDFFAKY